MSKIYLLNQSMITGLLISFFVKKKSFQYSFYFSEFFDSAFRPFSAFVANNDVDSVFGQMNAVYNQHIVDLCEAINQYEKRKYFRLRIPIDFTIDTILDATICSCYNLILNMIE